MFVVLQVGRLALQAVLRMAVPGKEEGRALKDEGAGRCARDRRSRLQGCGGDLMDERSREKARRREDGDADRVEGAVGARASSFAKASADMEAPRYEDRVVCSRPRSLLPVVVVDAEAKKPVVVEMTAAAAREGVVVGLSIPQALARCEGLVVRHRSAQAERAVEELLFAMAYSLSPRVERDGVGRVLVDLRGTKLEEALGRCGEIVGELAELGLVVGIGVAESCVVAGLAAGVVGRSFDWAQDALAGRILCVGDGEIAAPVRQAQVLRQGRFPQGEDGLENDGEVGEAKGVYGGTSGLRNREDGGDGVVCSRASSLLHGEGSPAGRSIQRVELGTFLAGVEMGAMPFGGAQDAFAGRAKLLDVLEKWGIRTLAAFAGLKRSAVGARLGVEGLALWDRVTGREERVVAVAELPAEFVESWDFEYDVDSVEPLLFLLRRFLDTLGARMRAGHKVAAFARVELRLAYGEPMVVEQKLPEPTSDAGALFGLLAARLEEVEAESPVAAMELRLEVVDFRERQLGLFESSLKNPYRFTQTLSRVAGIVGEDRVGRPVVSDDGRPDGVRMEALPASVPPVVGELDLRRLFGMPLRRYRPGRKAAVEFQGRMPIWIQCEGVSGFVKAARGPWLHSGHWWEDEGSWNRVEWDVELNKGGVYRICKDGDGWRVEGEY